ncbi:alpha/beta fold hydrolase [Paeniroseomonas aquatica]|uniref:alpha/beta fold hydrolase n=1 Tax=Paeniroseomonas aquatica TaxID=373043 RepID=UPI00360B6B31
MRLNVVEAGEGPPVVLLHGLFGSGQNWGGIQRQLATRHRVLAIDLRNHGASPRAAAMDYPAMAADVAETMAGVTAAPAAVLGHSMGGKVAMVLALQEPQLVSRLVVADIAPIRYPPALRAYVEAMQAITLRPGLTRRDADAALAETIPEPGIRAFLLQNLRLQESPPDWRLGLAEIAAAMPGIEGFPSCPGAMPGRCWSWPGNAPAMSARPRRRASRRSSPTSASPPWPGPATGCMRRTRPASSPRWSPSSAEAGPRSGQRASATSMVPPAWPGAPVACRARLASRAGRALRCSATSCSIDW